MPKQELKIDLVCRQILDRSGLEPDAVDRIAAGPFRLQSAFDRIPHRRTTERGIETYRRYQFIVGRVAVFGAFLTLSVFGYWAFTTTVSDLSLQEQDQIVVPAVMPEGVRPITPPDGVVSEQTASRAPQIYRASVRDRAPKKRPVRREATTRSDAAAVQPAEFMSLGLRSTAEQASGGGRVVRVDLPAASLFAMGIDVPIENGAESVRADLIIGPDGVTRAVKLVE